MRSNVLGSGPLWPVCAAVLAVRLPVRADFRIDALLQNFATVLPGWLESMLTTLGGFAFVTIGITPVITLVLAAAYLLFALGQWLFDRDEKDQPTPQTHFTIAIDGPAASGKGTLARRIAEAYGFHHLDTGLTYRAVAKALMDQNMPLDDEFLAEKAARQRRSVQARPDGAFRP